MCRNYRIAEQRCKDVQKANIKGDEEKKYTGVWKG